VHVTEDKATFAAQLNELFARSPSHTTNTAVARALTDGGCSISIPYLSQLRTGVRTRPDDRYIQALAEYFGVSPSHFYDMPFENEADTYVEQDLVLINAIQDSAVRRLLCNARGLSTSALNILLRLQAHLHAPGPMNTDHRPL
jgi:transcriptional regulator with XRE-family HTH domain